MKGRGVEQVAALFVLGAAADVPKLEKVCPVVRRPRVHLPDDNGAEGDSGRVGAEEGGAVAAATDHDVDMAADGPARRRQRLALAQEVHQRALPNACMVRWTAKNSEGTAASRKRVVALKSTLCSLSLSRSLALPPPSLPLSLSLSLFLSRSLARVSLEACLALSSFAPSNSSLPLPLVSPAL